LEAKTMSSKSALSNAQWRKIERYLPETRRNRLMIEAILFREFSGQSLTDVAEVFGITRVRLFQWEHAIEAVLPAIMAALRLESAGPLARCRSGSRPSYRRDQAMVDAVAAIRFQSFREALRGSR
jgi:hypothetical protein